MDRLKRHILPITKTLGTYTGDQRAVYYGANWFSRGGMVFQANLQNPVLAYLRRQEIPAAIRDLYNDFVSCYYPDVNVFIEEYRQWRSPSGPFYKVPDEARFVTRLRDLLVREEGTDLWLASGMTGSWISAVRVRIHGGTQQ